MVSKSLLPLVTEFHVETPTPDPKDDWADHMRIGLTLDASQFDRAPIPSRAHGATMDSRESPDEALDSLWGVVSVQSPSTHVYVEGVVSKTAAAGAGIFFGTLSPLNSSLLVPGPHFGTADRARIFSIHETLRTVAPTTTLSAANNMMLGWPGPNGDIYKATIKLLASRHAETCFVHVDSNTDNTSKKQAYTLAKTAQKRQATKNGTNLLASDVFLPPVQHVVPTNGKNKIYTDLPEVSPPRRTEWETGDDDDDEDQNPGHRGRAKIHALQAGLRKELLECQDNKEIWDFVRKRSDPRPKKAKVALEDLSADFECRLHYPTVTPSSFNAEQLAFNKCMAEELRENPVLDTSPRQSYTRDITIAEIEAMKRHVKKHGLDTAVGCEHFSYKEGMEIPDEKILKFFHVCIRNRDASRAWLMAILIRILKQDKDATDPLAELPTHPGS
ncbi:hypothetical protein B0H17DRAFT_1203256 [Mycena rosella]|uniref:Uncharacterized protein n=1 Tax=Mycena rosella TaxID=1033263 RepID=A0AAD7GHD6_MYCRO|nr:hypothetical protein B0H17DRAFT_1203256 [Mycena rosella]